MKTIEKLTRAEDKQIFLNFAVPGGLFLFTAIILLSLLKVVNGHLPTSIRIFDLVLCMLCSWRMIRGATYDKLMRFPRELFKYEKECVTENGIQIVVRKESPNGTWKRAITETIECSWCTGFWTTLITLFLYFVSPVFFIIILLFAVSAVASFMQILVNLIATKYEQLDIQNEKM